MREFSSMGKKAAVIVCAVAAAVAAAGAVVVVRRQMEKSGKFSKAMAIVKEFQNKCETPIPKLFNIADSMTVEMHAGLASAGGSKLKMLISYVDNLPNGYMIFIPNLDYEFMIFRDSFSCF